jgi:hypothetical protein
VWTAQPQLASGVRLKLRGTCRGGPPWPPLGRQITYRKNLELSRLPGLPPSTTRSTPLQRPEALMIEILNILAIRSYSKRDRL